MYRRNADPSGVASWEYRRHGPFAVIVVQAFRPDTSHAGGHSATSPWNRYPE